MGGKCLFFISSATASTLKPRAGGLCSSTLDKLKGFACFTSESSVGHRDTERDGKTSDDAQNKEVRDQKPCHDTERHLEDDKLLEVEEENEEEEGRSWLTDSKKVLNLDATILSLERHGGSEVNRFITQMNLLHLV